MPEVHGLMPSKAFPLRTVISMATIPAVISVILFQCPRLMVNQIGVKSQFRRPET